MFIKKWRWKLSGKNQRVSIRVFGANKKKPLTFQAILDTGSSNCVFSQEDFQTLFEGDPMILKKLPNMTKYSVCITGGLKNDLPAKTRFMTNQSRTRLMRNNGNGCPMALLACVQLIRLNIRNMSKPWMIHPGLTTSGPQKIKKICTG